MTASIKVIAATLSLAAALSVAGAASSETLYGGTVYGYYGYGYGDPDGPAYRGGYYDPGYGYPAWRGPGYPSRRGHPDSSESVNRGQPGCASSIGWRNC